uniref:Uncharacterized protein n=1 Tax=Zooxanthella nutricula TaxID=1333877 RepID=A0A7S2IQZ1_9DINO|mmetsp:Transcript_21220/g.63419  ORF Transcript_21220/g.63419 Transcript_21220/m.63419 type:complete len:114 (+) Transcript_21220:118-459(+)
MRTYLDSHDVLRQMEDLLEDMATNRPPDPLEHLIQHLEQACRGDGAADTEEDDTATPVTSCSSSLPPSSSSLPLGDGARGYEDVGRRPQAGGGEYGSALRLPRPGEADPPGPV